MERLANLLHDGVRARVPVYGRLSFRVEAVDTDHRLRFRKLSLTAPLLLDRECGRRGVASGSRKNSEDSRVVGWSWLLVLICGRGTLPAWPRLRGVGGSREDVRGRVAPAVKTAGDEGAGWWSGKKSKKPPLLLLLLLMLLLLLLLLLWSLVLLPRPSSESKPS